MSNKAAARALELVGDGYIYGAKGQICSQAFRHQQAEQYPDQAGNILNTGAKWDGKPVWDCAQLTREAAKAAGVSLVSGATSQWNQTVWEDKGTIDTLPPDETLFLYRRQSGSTTVMQHTGVALGDGTCVHARGTAYGVVRQNVTEYPWTHWARPVWPGTQPNKGEETMYRARVTGPAGETVNLRSAANSGAAVKTRIRVGEEISAGDDVGGWRSVEYKGTTGYMMAEFVQILTGDKPEAAGDMVTIALPRSVAETLLEAFNKGVGG